MLLSQMRPFPSVLLTSILSVLVIPKRVRKTRVEQFEEGVTAMIQPSNNLRYKVGKVGSCVEVVLDVGAAQNVEFLSAKFSRPQDGIENFSWAPVQISPQLSATLNLGFVGPAVFPPTASSPSIFAVHLQAALPSGFNDDPTKDFASIIGTLVVTLQYELGGETLTESIAFVAYPVPVGTCDSCESAEIAGGQKIVPTLGCP